MHFVAKCYWDGKSLTVDRELAIYYYHKSAEQSYIPSARMLGKSYIDGSMTRIDLDNAMFFLKKAWYAGCIDSGMILMSTCMKEKRDYDTVKDICETVIYTPPEKNNEINTIRCKFILCSILFYGLGDIPKNKDEAIRYAKEAAYTIDNAYGHEYLGNIYETMYIQKNREENEYLDLAYKEYKIAAELDGNIFGKNINRFVERYGILDD